MDQIRRQLGKRDAIARLIRNGYYNWAVQDLRSGNNRTARPGPSHAFTSGICLPRSLLT